MKRLLLLGALTPSACSGDRSATDIDDPMGSAVEFTFAAIAAGAIHTCGLHGDGGAYCWDDNIYVMGNCRQVVSWTAASIFIFNQARHHWTEVLSTACMNLPHL